MNRELQEQDFGTHGISSSGQPPPVFEDKGSSDSALDDISIGWPIDRLSLSNGSNHSICAPVSFASAASVNGKKPIEVIVGCDELLWREGHFVMERFLFNRFSSEN